jgi:hypothetical protein
MAFIRIILRMKSKERSAAKVLIFPQSAKKGRYLKNKNMAGYILSNLYMKLINQFQPETGYRGLKQYGKDG